MQQPVVARRVFFSLLASASAGGAAPAAVEGPQALDRPFATLDSATVGAHVAPEARKEGELHDEESDGEAKTDISCQDNVCGRQLPRGHEQLHEDGRDDAPRGGELHAEHDGHRACHIMASGRALLIPNMAQGRQW